MQHDLHENGAQEEWKELNRKERNELKSIKDVLWSKRIVQIIQIRFKYVKMRNKLRDKMYAKHNIVIQ